MSNAYFRKQMVYMLFLITTFVIGIIPPAYAAQVNKGSLPTPTIEQLKEQKLLAGQSLDPMLKHLAQRLETEHLKVNTVLTRLKYKPINNFSEDVSARSLLEFAMKRAESGRPGDAKKLLSVFRDEYAKNSAAIATDPVLRQLGQYSSSQLRDGFIFKENINDINKVKLDSIRLEKAVNRFAQLQPATFELKPLVMRCCIKSGSIAQFDRITQSAKTHQERITQLLQLEPPPPTQNDKMKTLINDFRTTTAARQIDPNLHNIVKSLDTNLPNNYAKIDSIDRNSVPTLSRENQALAKVANALADSGDIATANKLTKTSKATNNTTIKTNIMSAVGDSNIHGLQTFSAAAPATPPAYPSRIGSAEIRLASVQAKASIQAYERFISKTFTGSNSIPKSFASASRSIRGPGGISFGAKIVEQPTSKPISVTWLANPENTSYGYFLFKLTNRKQRVHYAVSNLLYAESASAAWIALFNPLKDTLKYVEGEVFPVVTIDRFYDGADLLPAEKPIAVNPALSGLRLAWSVSRVDFWFTVGKAARNDIKAIFCPTSNNCQAFQEEPVTAWQYTEELATWQFHDKPRIIKLRPGKNPGKDPDIIQVCSPPMSQCRNKPIRYPHLTISPFAKSDLIKSELLGSSIGLAVQSCGEPKNETDYKCIYREFKDNWSYFATLARIDDEANAQIVYELTKTIMSYR
ncbi:MAG: hypothetical protein ACI8WB_005261, partial [Phenylobacterium sp.]